MIINYSDEEVKTGSHSIFLAGPTPRSLEVATWRTDAIKILEELNYSGIVYVPEYKKEIVKEDYVDQAMWERNALTSATVIVFWIPRDLDTMPAFTTNVEFGYWLHTNKVLYGRPDEAPKNKYLDWLYKVDYNKEPYNDMKALLKEAVNFKN